MVWIDPCEAHAQAVHYHFDHDELVAMIKRELAGNKKIRDRSKKCWGAIYNMIACLDGSRITIAGVELSRLMFLADDAKHKDVSLLQTYDMKPERLENIVGAAEARHEQWPERQVI